MPTYCVKNLVVLIQDKAERHAQAMMRRGMQQVREYKA